MPARSVTSPPNGGAASGRARPKAIRRLVWQRDGGRCTYVDPRSGRRCASSHLLQIDHVLPYALGGVTETGNLRLLCAPRRCGAGRGDHLEAAHAHAVDQELQDLLRRDPAAGSIST